MFINRLLINLFDRIIHLPEKYISIPLLPAPHKLLQINLYPNLLQKLYT